MQKIILSRHVVPMSGVLSQQTGTDGSIAAPRRGEMNSFSVAPQPETEQVVLN